MKSCLTSLVIREIQIKTTARCHFILTRIAIASNNSSKTPENSRFWCGVLRNQNPLCFSWECKKVQKLWKTVWWFFKRLNVKLPCDPVIPYLYIYLKELIIGIQNKICTQMFIALVTIAKRGKHPQYLSVNEQISKMSFHTAECSLSPKKWSTDICYNMDKPWKCYA